MDETIILLRVYKTTLQLLNDRKYDIENYKNDLSFTRDDFIKKYGKETEIKIDLEKLELTLSKIDNPEDKINVYWFDDIKIDGSTATEYNKKLEKNKINRGLVIIKNKNLLPPNSKRIFQESSLYIGKTKIIIDLFYYNELIINITEHHLVPKHIPLNKEEKENLLKKFKESQLPKIQSIDPVAKYLGLQKGDIIRIEKENNIGERYVSYRSIV